MRKLLLISIFSFVSLLCSCISTHEFRAPASQLETEAIKVQEILSIPKLIGEDATDSTRTHEAISDYYKRDGMKIQFSPGELGEDIAYEMKVILGDDDNFILAITYNKGIDQHPRSRAYIERLLKSLFKDSNVFEKYFQTIEFLGNIQQGDIYASLKFSELKLRALQALSASTPDGSLDNEIEKAKGLIERLTDSLSAQKKNARKIEKQRKEHLKTLDSAPKDEQLRELARAGKRFEVASLIDKYLPREYMTPAELEYWEQALDAIRNPLPLHQRVLVFRGIHDDPYYPSTIAIDVSRNQADHRSVLLSSILSKNQGTWNRRLRSLQTLNDKYITQSSYTGSNEFTSAARISTMSYKHSLEPKGSPFLSWTPKISVANTFGENQMVAALIDPRLLMMNHTSSFANEVELLSPLVTFPDEMVANYDASKLGKFRVQEKEEYFLKMLKEKLSLNYDGADTQMHYETIVKNYESYRRASQVKELTEVTPVQTQAKKTFRDYLKKIFRPFHNLWKRLIKKKPVEEIVHKAQPNATRCQDFLRSFVK